jgi:hypothetical protein
VLKCCFCSHSPRRANKNLERSWCFGCLGWWSNTNRVAKRKSEFGLRQTIQSDRALCSAKLELHESAYHRGSVRPSKRLGATPDTPNRLSAVWASSGGLVDVQEKSRSPVSSVTGVGSVMIWRGGLAARLGGCADPFGRWYAMWRAIESALESSTSPGCQGCTGGDSGECGGS